MQLTEHTKVARAAGTIAHYRPSSDGTLKLLSEETVYNLKTDTGIDFMHDQCYGTSPNGNGLNYIALSNSGAGTETAASTTLGGEISTNGLARAQGAYAHTAGTTTSTVSKTFTATGTQSCQKAALFRTASGPGSMHHVLTFTQVNLVASDVLIVTFTLGIS